VRSHGGNEGGRTVLNSQIHFMDGTTNGELAGHGVQTPSAAFTIPTSLPVNGVQYGFCFADITDGAIHTFGAPPDVPAGGIAYLWYAPAELLWDNGPGAPNAWFTAYDASKDGHRVVLVPLDIKQGGQQIPLISGWWTVGYVHTDGAATTAIAPPSASHGTQFKAWAKFIGSQLQTGNVLLPNPLDIAAGWAGGCLAVYR
jgi:hypothetical protein